MQPSIPLALSCSSTPVTHAELGVHQVPFHRAAPHAGQSQPLLHSWILFSQVKDLTELAELCKVLVCPFFQPIQVFLLVGSPFPSFQLPTQFGVLSKRSQAAPFLHCVQECTILQAFPDQVQLYSSGLRSETCMLRDWAERDPLSSQIHQILHSLDSKQTKTRYQNILFLKSWCLVAPSLACLINSSVMWFLSIEQEPKQSF